MKNSFKLFLAVVALFAYSCVTDTAEDLTVKVDGGQTTEITLSLEESRTQLGEKVDGLYPLYWSSEDKISVNGVESGEAVINDSNPASATFTIAGELATPYCIAYPAAPVGQVIFAENQTHAGNSTFGNGVTTMYAYGVNTGVQLNHLTGVLKIGVTGNAIISFVQISTVDRAPIAGEFDFDFEKGEAKATEASKYVISYTFPETADAEGLLLSSDPQYIHVAVPAGVYDELYVTLYDKEGGVMYATVKADEQKPLAVGKVREFKSPIAYAPNAEAFIIKDAESLREFATAAPTATKDAIFVADVDMTGAAWTPIEGYAGTIHGNGYAIKGLTAPLFGTTNASFKGLHLVDVDINETKTPNVGAFARRIYATETIKPTIEHCSVSGKMVVDCKDYVYQAESQYFEFAIGGLVGAMIGADMHCCSNSAELELKQCVAQNNTKEIRPNLGGCLGSLESFEKSDKSKVYGNMSHCTNTGAIKIGNGSYNGETDNVMQMVGGVIGINFNGNRNNTIEYLTNSGDITLDATFSKLNSRMGGVAGWIYANNFSHCINKGNFTWNSGSFTTLYYGGIVGYGANASRVSDAVNEGNITIKEGIYQGVSLVLGGVFGYLQENNVDGGHLTNSTNKGDISIHADMLTKSATVAYFRIGGIAGWSQCIVENGTNEGDINISGNLYNAETDVHFLSIGGIVGYKTIDEINNSTNSGDINFNGTVGYADNDDGNNCNLLLGGIAGYTGAGGSNSTNSGNITVSGSSYVLFAGGLYGRQGGIASNSTNSGNITIKENTAVNSSLYIGGISAYGTGEMSGCENSGTLTIEKKTTTASSIFVGGITSQNACTLANCSNSGSITLEEEIQCGKYLMVGGITGWMLNAVTNVENSGAITCKDITVANNTYTSGCIAYSELTTENIVLSKLTNRGNISFKGSVGGAKFYTAGCLGLWNKNYTGQVLRGADNYGSINVEASASGDEAIVGGVVGYMYGKGSRGLHNHKTGTITVDIEQTGGKIAVGGMAYGLRHTLSGPAEDESANGNDADIFVTGSTKTSLDVAGIITTPNNYNRNYATNNGNITITGAIVGTDLNVGGFGYGIHYGKNVKGVVNNGDITIDATTKVQGSASIGGYAGGFTAMATADIQTFDACRNTGDITFSGEAGLKGTGDIRIGGWLATLSGTTSKDTNANFTNGFTNSGNITYNGKLHSTDGAVYIGGVIGEYKLVTKNNSAWTGEVAFTGNISCTGTHGATTYVGGIFGDANCSAANCKVDSTIAATGYNNVGMLIGTPRSADVFISNCKVRGSILGVALTAENYFDYLYGGTTDWSGVTDYDGCVFLTE